MPNTKDTGDETESRIIHELITNGYSVSIPFGDNDRYDHVVDTGDRLLRVQCKTGWIEEDCVRFKTASKTTVDGEVQVKGYGGDIDAFAVRCQDSARLFWVPEDEAGEKNAYLRLGEPAIDHPHVNRAEEYLFASNLPE